MVLTGPVSLPIFQVLGLPLSVYETFAYGWLIPSHVSNFLLAEISSHCLQVGDVLKCLLGMSVCNLFLEMHENCSVMPEMQAGTGPGPQRQS